MHIAGSILSMNSVATRQVDLMAVPAAGCKCIATRAHHERQGDDRNADSRAQIESEIAPMRPAIRRSNHLGRTHFYERSIRPLRSATTSLYSMLHAPSTTLPALAI